MKYQDLHCSCCKKWDKGVRRYEIEGATQRLCPECFKRICDIKLKQSLEKAGNKPNKSKQIALFSEEDLAKKDPEPIYQNFTKYYSKRELRETMAYERWADEQKTAERKANEPLELERLAVAQKANDSICQQEEINNPTYLTECVHYINVARCTIRCIARYCAECDDYKSKKRK